MESPVLLPFPARPSDAQYRGDPYDTVVPAVKDTSTGRKKN